MLGDMDDNDEDLADEEEDEDEEEEDIGLAESGDVEDGAVSAPKDDGEVDELAAALGAVSV